MTTPVILIEQGRAALRAFVLPPPRRRSDSGLASLLITLLALAVSPHPLAAEGLSRADVVQRALQINPDVLKSQQDLSILEGRGKQALADALPELTLVGSALRYRDPSLLNSPSFDAFPLELRDSLTPSAANLYEGSARLRQTIFSFKLGRAIHAAHLALDLGHEDVRRARQAVALVAIRAYHEYVLSIEKAHVAEKSVRQKEKHLEMARNRRAAGVATELEVLRAEVSLANEQAQMLALQGQAEQDRGALNAVMVRPIETPIEPTDALTFEPFPVTLEQVIEEAWANRPEVKAVSLTERILEDFVGVAQADSRPRLDLDTAYGFSVRRPGNFFDRDFAKWSAAVTLTVPVFDGYRTAGKVAQARADRAKATQDRIALENRIRLEARSAFDRLHVAERIFQVAELNVKQAERALDMTQANYGHGAATSLDVLDAQAALTQAESNRLLSLYEHANARAGLRFVMARDPLESPAGGDAR